MSNKEILIVVDTQNDFLLEDGSLYIGHDTSTLRKKIATYVRDFEGKIFVTQDTHEADSCEFKENGGPFPAHCVLNTKGWEVVDEIEDALYKKYVTKLLSGCRYCIYSNGIIAYPRAPYIGINVVIVHIMIIKYHSFLLIKLLHKYKNGKIIIKWVAAKPVLKIKKLNVPVVSGSKYLPEFIDSLFNLRIIKVAKKIKPITINWLILW